MNAYTTREQLTLVPSDRVSHPEHFAEARHGRSAKPAGIVKRIAAYFERQRVLSELSSLSDRELVDIGLTRGELPQVFESSFATRR